MHGPTPRIAAGRSARRRIAALAGATALGALAPGAGVALECVSPAGEIPSVVAVSPAGDVPPGVDGSPAVAVSPLVTVSRARTESPAESVLPVEAGSPVEARSPARPLSSPRDGPAARDEGRTPGWSVRWGAFGGVLALDRDLADFRWQTEPRAFWGLQGQMERANDGHRAGLRIWRTRTTQATGIPGDDPTPRVTLTGVEALGEIALARAAGIRVRGIASGGVVRVGYSPDRIEVDPSGTGPITVSLDPITEIAAGAGIGLERSFGRRVGLGLRVERSMFRLDTSHRAGDEILNERRTFAQWTVSLALTHRTFAAGGSR